MFLRLSCEALPNTVQDGLSTPRVLRLFCFPQSLGMSQSFLRRRHQVDDGLRALGSHSFHGCPWHAHFDAFLFRDLLHERQQLRKSLGISLVQFLQRLLGHLDGDCGSRVFDGPRLRLTTLRQGERLRLRLCVKG